jgi:hypothetical protein
MKIVLAVLSLLCDKITDPIEWTFTLVSRRSAHQQNQDFAGQMHSKRTWLADAANGLPGFHAFDVVHWKTAALLVFLRAVGGRAAAGIQCSECGARLAPYPEYSFEQRFSVNGRSQERCAGTVRLR